MTFKKWIDQQVRLSNRPMTHILTDFAESVHISFTTIKGVYYGQKLQKYDLAKRVSEQTGGDVSIKELCE